MVLIRSRSALRNLLLPIGLVALLLVLVSVNSARASQPNDVIDNKWELLAEQILGQVGDYTFSLPRGTLPMGTSGFDPAPQATFEVLAKVTGSTAVNRGYTVHLINTSGGDIASAFVPGGPNATMALVSATFQWPASNVAIGGIRVVRTDAMSGALDVYKASIRFHQTGTIKAVTARVPLATRQPQTTSTSWTAVADPAIYQHVEGDYSPSPAIRLRVTAKQYVCGSFKARLQDETAIYEEDPNNPGEEILVHPPHAVEGSELPFGTGGGSSESGALTLEDGHRYRLHAMITLDGCTQQDRAGGQPEPTVPTGDLISADLTFEQSTTDPDGIDRTVAFFPGVTAATDFATDNAVLNADTTFLPPSLPNPVVPQWLATMKRTGAVGSVGADLRFGSSTASNVQVSVGDYDLIASQAAFALPAPQQPTVMATRGRLYDGAVRGRIAASLLRLPLQLRDVTVPQVSVTGLTVSRSAFGPQGNSPYKQVTFSASARDFSPLTWKLDISDGTQVVRSQEGPLGNQSNVYKSVSVPWDGKDHAGAFVDPGTYLATMTFTDTAGKFASTPAGGLPVTVDNQAPTISGFTADSGYSGTPPERFSPNADTFFDSVSIVSQVDEPSLVVVSAAMSGQPTQQVGTGQGTSVPMTWTGTGVPDGTYDLTAVATDVAGNTGSAGPVAVVRDTVAPEATAAPTFTNPAFSPNGDLVKDTTSMTATFADDWTGGDWTVELLELLGDSEVSIDTVAQGSGLNPTWLWDGQVNAATVPDGSYVGRVLIRDGGMNAGVHDVLIQVDTQGPSLLKVTPRENANVLEKRPNITVEFSDAATLTSATLSLNGDALVTELDDEENLATATPVQDLALNVDATLAATATDAAGNVGQASRVFRRVDVAFDDLPVSLPQVSAVTPSGCLVGCTVTFPAVSARIGAHTVAISSRLHGGDLTVRRSAEFPTAQVTYDLGNGVTQIHPAPIEPVDAFDLAQFQGASSQAAEATIAAYDLQLGAISLDVPPGIPPGTSASLEMPNVEEAIDCVTTAEEPLDCGVIPSPELDALQETGAVYEESVYLRIRPPVGSKTKSAGLNCGWHNSCSRAEGYAVGTALDWDDADDDGHTSYSSTFTGGSKAVIWRAYVWRTGQVSTGENDRAESHVVGSVAMTDDKWDPCFQLAVEAFGRISATSSAEAIVGHQYFQHAALRGSWENFDRELHGSSPPQYNSWHVGTIDEDANCGSGGKDHVHDDGTHIESAGALTGIDMGYHNDPAFIKDGTECRESKGWGADGCPKKILRPGADPGPYPKRDPTWIRKDAWRIEYPYIPCRPEYCEQPAASQIRDPRQGEHEDDVGE